MIRRLWYPEDGRSPPAALPLLLPELLFRAGVSLKNLAYDRGWATPYRPAARVISVGNINVGGAGKTPVVIALGRRLLGAGAKVAVLSRGYGRVARHPVHFSGRQPLRLADEVGDEPRLLAQELPGAELFVGPDRVELARRAVDAGATHLLLDDGMQHRRLARDVEIAVVDERLGFGTGALLPRGPLREPPAALRRASFIWLKQSAQARGPLPLPAGVPLVRARHAPVAARDPDGAQVPLLALAGRRWHAFAGIARPEAFFESLAALGLQPVARTAFPDHHRYRPRELEALAASPAEPITTEKDRARLPAGFRTWSLLLGVEILEGEAALMRALV